MHRWLLVILLAVLGLMQYQLWLGNGGWRDLQRVEERVAEQEAANQPLRERNARLAAEVTDLKTGLAAIEERARSDMGMVRSDEQFFWVPGVAIENELLGIHAGLIAQPGVIPPREREGGEP
ncbi:MULTISPECIES: cell division protein FtsB [Halomonadaceae]|uniref:Cell division protein FtsB n=2 Tax=Halomonadaceae TaxID=28256 RepID=A0A8H9ILN3_9GAMM|nr:MULTISPECIES: cell division protein FtsB [Halomonas]ATH76376.1 cell division protein FtsB [Halomonas hydrothermalis]NGO89185.1 cell division protein FtsB [Halomonas sp.]PJX14841.1 cell division protein FtsB [Halomonas sp. 141]UDM08101.1 cell division protein FtsB [Halomonas sp. NyZ770]GGW61112.1 cell division protein FtsB [Halomonas johnsoniae]